jgi:hypothetical protein
VHMADNLPRSSADVTEFEYQDTPGGKDGRCVCLTTYHVEVLMSRNLEALTSQNALVPIGLYNTLLCKLLTLTPSKHTIPSKW